MAAFSTSAALADGLCLASGSAQQRPALLRDAHARISMFLGAAPCVSGHRAQVRSNNDGYPHLPARAAVATGAEPKRGAQLQARKNGLHSSRLIDECRGVAVRVGIADCDLHSSDPVTASAAEPARATATAASVAELRAAEAEAGLEALAETERERAAAPGTVRGPASLVSGRRTGGSWDFRGATEALVPEPLLHEKRIVLVRHGLSSWNEEGRVQGSSDGSVLSEQGELQALRCREALRFLPLDGCFASPISRAKKSAELMWDGRDGPLTFLDCLKEANLLFLEGMLNSDAKVQYPAEFRAWREDPANFNVNGVFPVRRLWGQAREAWQAILNQEGSTILVVTHKSLLRALICTALGMGPERFRSMDVNNGGICLMRVSRSGEPMLEGLNLTAHLQCEAVHYNL